MASLEATVAEICITKISDLSLKPFYHLTTGLQPVYLKAERVLLGRSPISWEKGGTRGIQVDSL